MIGLRATFQAHRRVKNVWFFFPQSKVISAINLSLEFAHPTRRGTVSLATCSFSPPYHSSAQNNAALTPLLASMCSVSRRSQPLTGSEMRTPQMMQMKDHEIDDTFLFLLGFASLACVNGVGWCCRRDGPSPCDGRAARSSSSIPHKHQRREFLKRENFQLFYA